MDPTSFQERVWQAAVSIPCGKVTTYGLLARAGGGGRQAARSVSRVLSTHPKRSEVPFHRIVYSGGKVWLDPSCREKRIRQYKKEGIEVVDSKIQNFRDKLHTFGFE